MHIGGHGAVKRLLDNLGLKPGMHALDIGCGTGGAARMAAETYGVQVTGIDLNPDFIVQARENGGNGLSFKVCNALDMPFEDGTFDAAWTIHAGMNIADKAVLYAEIHRVLKPGTVFGVYDILAGENAAAMRLPVPWARVAEMSFLVSSDELRTLLEQAGFEIATTESRHAFALETLMPDTPERVNLRCAVEVGACGPWEIIARRQ